MVSMHVIITKHNKEDKTYVTFRMCGADLGGCVSQDIGGASVTVCSCKTENCNKDQECDCSSSTTIGISAMALLVSAFVLFEME